MLADRETSGRGGAAAPCRTRSSTSASASLAEREQELARREAELRAQDPAEREARIDEHAWPSSEAAELQFVKTHAELAARSERLAEREQELTERERALPGGNGIDTDDRVSPVDIEAIEARLRRLEQSGGGPSFSDGLRALEQRGAPPARRAGLASTLRRQRGALAQLGERRLCKPEVAGSIPARSMKKALLDAGLSLSNWQSDYPASSPDEYRRPLGAFTVHSQDQGGASWQ